MAVWVIRLAVHQLGRDRLLANNRQPIHRRPSLQASIPAGVDRSADVPACCGTSVLCTAPLRERFRGGRPSALAGQ